MFKYNITLSDNQRYEYDFTLVDGGQTGGYGNAELVWVTDSQYNFTLLWNEILQRYEITSGYFKGGRIESDIVVDGEVVSCYIYLGDLTVYLSIP